MWVLWLVLFPGLTWALPGALWVWRLRPDASPLERAGWSLLFGGITVVPVAYLLSFLVRAPLTPITMGVAAVAVGALALLVPRPTPETDVPPRPERSDGRWVVLALLAVASYSALHTAPKAVETTQIWAPCIHESAFLMLEDGSGHGLRVYDPTLDDWISHRTMRPTEPAWGLSSILGHQRPGSMAIIAQAVAMHGSAGPVVMTFIDDLLILWLAALIISALSGSAIMTVLGSVAFLFGARHVAVYMVNENVVALALTLGTISLLVRQVRPPLLVLAGLALALTVGVRPVALTMLPAALWLTRGGRTARLALLTGLGLGLLPWLGTHFAVYGNPLYHPSLDVPQLQQSVWGFSVRFHPLNFPIADTLVRPHHALLPLMLSMPLEHTAAFGGAFCIVAVVGLVALPWRERLGWLAIGAPVYGLLSLIVALDYEKQSYALLAFAPLPVLFGAGSGALFGRTTLGWGQRVAAALLAFGLLLGLRLVAPTLELPIDPRPQYVRPTISSGDPRYLQAQSPEAAWEQLLHIDAWPQHQPVPGLAWTLLQRATPAHLDAEPYNTPVMLWRDSDAFAHEFTLIALPDQAPSALLSQLGPDCGNRGSVMLFDLRVPVPAGTVITAETQLPDRHTLDLRLTADIENRQDGKTDTYARVVLGVHDTALDVIRSVRVRWNDAALPLHAVVTERARPGAPMERSFRLLTTADWQPVWTEGAVRLRPIASPARCTSQHTQGGSTRLGPGYARIDRPGQACTLRVIDQIPATPFVDPCP